MLQSGYLVSGFLSAYWLKACEMSAAALWEKCGLPYELVHMLQVGPQENEVQLRPLLRLCLRSPRSRHHIRLCPHPGRHPLQFHGASVCFT